MTMNQRRHDIGFTLVELLVVLTVLGVITGVAGLAMHLSPHPVPPPAWRSLVAAGRDSALKSGRAVTVVVRRDGTPSVVTAWPDGRVLGGDELGIDPLAGKPGDATR